MGLLQRRRDTTDDTTAAHLADARAEIERLRVASTRAQAALDGLAVGVVLVDAEGTIVNRNEVARSLLAAGHAGVLVAEAVDRQLEQARHGRPGHVDVQLFGPPKRVVQVQAVLLADGGVLVTVEDISERARLDAVRTDFVANISHELKTPVGAIALLAETIVDEDDPEVVRRLANKMVDEAHRAATSIDDLLELSRIELDGRAVRERVSVAGVLRDAVVRSLAAAEQRDIRLDLDEPTEPLAVLGDRRQLVSALSNLIDNAVKYSESGTEVRIGTRSGNGFVGLVVTDFGVGIPTRDLDRVFERFYRVDRARSRDTGGTGLGLAIVRHVANNHDGDVTVQSVEGEGSTFILTIPEVP
jgi:two-component system sensor histidine kinase SenX3